jgi:hypothetical protein
MHAQNRQQNQTNAQMPVVTFHVRPPFNGQAIGVPSEDGTRLWSTVIASIVTGSAIQFRVKWVESSARRNLKYSGKFYQSA